MCEWERCGKKKLKSTFWGKTTYRFCSHSCACSYSASFNKKKDRSEETKSKGKKDAQKPRVKKAAESEKPRMKKPVGSEKAKKKSVDSQSSTELTEKKIMQETVEINTNSKPKIQSVLVKT